MCVHEVEVKAVLFLGDDLEEIEGELVGAEIQILEAGGIFKRKVDQMDIYLSHPARDFSETDEAFRIRVEDHEIVKLTYKGPKVSDRSKARLEKEVSIEIKDINGLRKVFSHLGFSEVISVIKERRIYDLEGIEVDLDKVTGLGLFCEMELLSDDIAGTEKRLIGRLEKLGWNIFERRSYMELLLEKQF